MRRLVAALACRNGGSRLFGKPMQNLVAGVTILDQILRTLEALPAIGECVLGISVGVENEIFVEIAKARGIPFIVGDQQDVLSRLIECARASQGSDVFRITTECPFLYYEPLVEAWYRHVMNGNDITVTGTLPLGTAFEIYTLEALVRSHRHGNDESREMCSRYAKQHADEFLIEVLEPEFSLRRPDLRLTVDYPEDLVVCREVYRTLIDKAPLIPLKEIVKFLDGRPDLKVLVQRYVKPPAYLWRGSRAASLAMPRN